MATYSSDTGLAGQIGKAIDGEYSAILCYEQLFHLANTEMEQRRIAEIRNDEIKHYRTFSSLYQTLTGKAHTPQVSGPCPDTYREALEHAIEDEQKTVDFYLEIADQASAPFIKSSFNRAAKDEQNHAVWFLYFYTFNDF